MAAHPAFPEAVNRLRSWGVTVLYGADVLELHPPGTGDRFLDAFPWHLSLDALEHHIAVQASIPASPSVE
jgi:hypothetical protein